MNGSEITHSPSGLKYVYETPELFALANDENTSIAHLRELTLRGIVNREPLFFIIPLNAYKSRLYLTRNGDHYEVERLFRVLHPRSAQYASLPTKEEVALSELSVEESFSTGFLQEFLTLTKRDAYPRNWSYEVVTQEVARRESGS